MEAPPVGNEGSGGGSQVLALSVDQKQVYHPLLVAAQLFVECVLLNVFSNYRMCSLTIECVLLL